MLRRSWLRAGAPLTALILAGALCGTSNPAQAAPTGPDATAAPTIARSSAMNFRLATTEQVLAMAAEGNGKLVTLGSKAAEGKGVDGGVTIQVTCYLDMTLPHGGGSADADILLDGWFTCDDYIHLGVLTVELFRGADRVANTTAVFPYVYGIFATAGLSTCTEGWYFGVVGATIARYDLNPPSDSLTIISYPVYIGCGPPPTTPPPATFAVTNPGNQTTFVFDSDQLQMAATGGTAPYTWSATGLPTGLSINSSTGLITGTVTKLGTYTVTATAVDAAGRSASAQFTWGVRREPCPTC
ncbi:hypothetical protein Rhe02_58010 [Rhizocola hellebori]|uniref:Uncharacterized protein n=1 Tax=Rhizocola hellebori TaxID=1392758 RepID=A0A8J3VHS9_9ACTN|nr:Ig domain-containing protein [Rhizocola hellebori]GIH07734.1 hypothetical protein Rhe02_58010 [Rhizocola hellebori]